MSDSLDLVYRSIDEQHADRSAHTRRQIVAGAAATLGGLGLLGLPGLARAADSGGNSVQNILNVAATAEVLATIVNTVGPERVNLDAVTRRNVRSAAREELIHYTVLTGLGAKPLTRTIWVPDAVFASKTGLLETLEAGDQIFVNAYLIATTVFAQAGSADNARYAAEFMGVEAVHRALARQSLGKLGNDRVFMRYQFTDVDVAVTQLKQAGFGFGARGAAPGAFYAFNDVRKRTPDPAGLNTFRPR